MGNEEPDKIFKKVCPISNNVTWVVYTESGKVKYIATSKRTNRDYYYLYSVDGDIYTKIASSRSPVELERKYIYKE